jgi:hypothetical protein
VVDIKIRVNFGGVTLVQFLIQDPFYCKRKEIAHFLTEHAQRKIHPKCPLGSRGYGSIYSQFHIGLDMTFCCFV